MALDPSVPTEHPAATPPAPTDTNPPATSTATVTLNGSAVEVPADLAETFRRELNARDGRHGREVQQLRQELQQLQAALQAPPADEPAGPQPPKAELFHVDPQTWQQQFDAYQAARVESMLAAQRAELAATTQAQRLEFERQRTWDAHLSSLYKRHPELEDEGDLVNMVMHQHFNELAPLGLNDAFEEIAKRAKQKIVRYAEKGKTLSARTAGVESSRPSGTPSAPAPAADEGPLADGISRQVRLMQARMRGIRAAS